MIPPRPRWSRARTAVARSHERAPLIALLVGACLAGALGLLLNVLRSVKP